MNDQKQLWNKAHQESALLDYSTTQTDFAEVAHQAIKPHAQLLELGCGVGNDSIYFAEQGHHVLATDFSDVLIGQNQAKYSNPNLQFVQQDMSQVLTFQNEQFDAIYARLSLHYFTDPITKQLFAEIARVLKSGGKLCFMCKSVEDRLYGKGTKIEPDMFELDGHVRHFFSESYAQELLARDFNIEVLETGKEDMYGKVSGFVKVIATKR